MERKITLIICTQWRSLKGLIGNVNTLLLSVDEQSRGARRIGVDIDFATRFSACLCVMRSISTKEISGKAANLRQRRYCSCRFAPHRPRHTLGRQTIGTNSFFDCRFRFTHWKLANWTYKEAHSSCRSKVDQWPICFHNKWHQKVERRMTQVDPVEYSCARKENRR